MSIPVIIRHDPALRGSGPTSLNSYGSSPSGSLPAFSPPSAYAYPGSIGAAGASPPFRGGSSAAAGDRSNPFLAAKKFWKRLCFDPALDPTEYSIGFIETIEQPERKSGVEAWSMRLHDRLLELPYNLFVERFCGGGGLAEPPSPTNGNPRTASPSTAFAAAFSSTSEEASSDVPYHRIAYFKHGNTLAWESEYHKPRLAYLPPATIPTPSSAYPEGAVGALPSSAERLRRRGSRDGILPTFLSVGPFGASVPPLLRTSVLGMASTASVPGRSPRGMSPTRSDDGVPGGSSDDEGVELLLEDDEEDELTGQGEDQDELGHSFVSRRSAALARGGGGGSSSCGTLLCGVGAAAAAAGAARADAAAAAAEVELPQLPEECWMAMLQLLGVRDVCMVGRTCRWLRQLAGDPAVWRAQYSGLWGAAPETSLSTAVVRRMCRRSELRAARWLEAAVGLSPGLGFAGTTCLQMDDSKVVSGDGNAVRLWSHATGRRIATLQGHPGRITSVAFDDTLLVSGCTGAVVKLWSMDELKCRRTLRHDGAVTSCCLLSTGIPVSGGEDGMMRLWDVASGAAIVTLEAGQPVLAMQAHGPSGHLVAAAGWGIQLWDVSTATLLHTLGASLDEQDDATIPGAAAPAEAQHHPYTCVSYMGDLLAAGRQGEVVLLDPRVNAPVGRLRCSNASGGVANGGASGSGMNGMGAIAAAAAGDGAAVALAGVAGASESGGGCRRGAPCVGVQMDEWKLVCGFKGGRHQLHVYDIRALPKAGSSGGVSGARRAWNLPLMTLTAPARINAFQFHEQSLLVGMEGAECAMWRFENPVRGPAGVGGAAVPAAASTAGSGSWARAGGGQAGGGAGASSGGVVSPAPEGGFDNGAGRKEKKKPAKVAKKQTRYPKRNTK